MHVNWTRAGELYSGTAEQRKDLLRRFSRLDWHPIPADAPAAPGLALAAMIHELGLPRPTFVAWNEALGPMSILGVVAEGYQGGPVYVFALDRGSDVVVLASGQHKLGPAYAVEFQDYYA